MDDADRTEIADPPEFDPSTLTQTPGEGTTPPQGEPDVGLPHSDHEPAETLQEPPSEDPPAPDTDPPASEASGGEEPKGKKPTEYAVLEELQLDAASALMENVAHMFSEGGPPTLVHLHPFTMMASGPTTARKAAHDRLVASRPALDDGRPAHVGRIRAVPISSMKWEQWGAEPSWKVKKIAGG